MHCLIGFLEIVSKMMGTKASLDMRSYGDLGGKSPFNVRLYH